MTWLLFVPATISANKVYNTSSEMKTEKKLTSKETQRVSLKRLKTITKFSSPKTIRKYKWMLGPSPHPHKSKQINKQINK